MAYPIWWDTSITLYNKYEDKQTQLIRWYKTTLDNCFWKYDGGKISIGNTVLETDTIKCRIPQNKNFLEKHEWINLPNDKMIDYFTISVGDIIVKGAIEDVIDEYHSGTRSSDLLAKYKDLQGCMQVQQLTINIGGGRTCPHYLIKGE